MTGRPSARAAQAEREARVLAATAQTLAERGYAGTTLQRIAAKAGISPFGLRDDFGDKDALALAVVEAANHGSMAAVGHAMVAADSWPAALAAAVRASLSMPARAPSFAWLCHVEIRAAGPRAQLLRHRLLGEWAKLVHDHYQQRRRGDPALPEVAYDAFRTAAERASAMITTWVQEGRAAELAALEEPLVALWLEHIGAEPAGAEPLAA